MYSFIFENMTHNSDLTNLLVIVFMIKISYLILKVLAMFLLQYELQKFSTTQY